MGCVRVAAAVRVAVVANWPDINIRACSGKRNTSKLADLPALQGRSTKIGELSNGRDLTYLPSKAGKSRKLADYDVFLFPEQTLIL